MDRLVWLLGEVGPALWLLPGFLCLVWSAWRGGRVACGLGLAAFITVAIQVTWPYVSRLVTLDTIVMTVLAQVAFFLLCFLAVLPFVRLLDRASVVKRGDDGS